jgi:hypothetical protein
MKVWDIRNSKVALKSFPNLANFGETNALFNPEGNLILTGTSVKKGEGLAWLFFMTKHR